MNLNVPKTRMRADYDCGGAALACVYGYFGRTLPEEYYKLVNPARGIGPEACEAVMRAEFGGIAWGQNWTLDDLEHHLGFNRPVMCLVSVEAASDHWVVVHGSEAGYVLYQDPAYGRRRKRRKNWLRWWHGPEQNAWARFGLVAWPDE